MPRTAVAVVTLAAATIVGTAVARFPRPTATSHSPAQTRAVTKPAAEIEADWRRSLRNLRERHDLARVDTEIALVFRCCHAARIRSAGRRGISVTAFIPPANYLQLLSLVATWNKCPLLLEAVDLSGRLVMVAARMPNRRLRAWVAPDVLRD